MTRTRYLLVAIASFVLVVFAHRAWADGAVPVPTPDESRWLAITALVVAIVSAVLGGLSLVFHIIAPLTKTKVDDNIRDEIDALRALITGQRTPPAQGGRVTLEMVIGAGIVMLGATMFALLLMGCTPQNKATLHQVEHDAVDCVKAEKLPALAKLFESVELLASGASSREVFDATADALVAGAGNVATCALKQAAVDLRERLAPISPDSTKVEGQDAVALDRINVYIAARGIVYARSP
jgi:hypothetical protein